MSPMSADDAVTLGVVVARLDDLRSDMARLSSKMDAHRADMVARGEWTQRNAHVDSRFDSQGREIADLRTELASRRAPWWSVAGAIAAVVAVALTIINALP